MENFLKPDNIYGFIKMTPKSYIEKFFISNCRLSLEKIKGKTLINLWAESSHFEIHNTKKIKVNDIGFEILMPIRDDLNIEKEHYNLIFPVANTEIIKNWEIYYDSTLYDLEHLKIVNCNIDILKINDSYKVKIKGFITDNIESFSGNHYFESEFETHLTDKIETKYNWNYSPENENYCQHRV